MRKLTQLWRVIEDIPGLIAVRAAWYEKCGPDFARIAGFLSPTRDLATRYPCPYPTGYDCPRLIIGDGGGEFEGICQDPHKLCPDVRLTAKDVVLQELDLDGFMKAILRAAGVKNPQLEPRAPGVWNAGLATGGDLSVQPAYLLIFGGIEEFGQAAQSLMFEVQGAFTIITPTERHWTGTLRERMRSPRINFISLNDRVLMNGNGEFVAIRRRPQADGMRPTPVVQREDLIGEFRQKNGNCLIKQICFWADVSREDLNKWKNGRTAIRDTSRKANRIEKLLQFGSKTQE